MVTLTLTEEDFDAIFDVVDEYAERYHGAEVAIRLIAELEAQTAREEVR